MKTFTLNHYFRNNLYVVITVVCLLFVQLLNAAQLASVEIIDRGVILITFKDGDIIFRDDAKGPSAYLSRNDPTENSVVLYGNPLNVEQAALSANWKIRSTDDPAYGSAGRSPQECFRKSKINGMGMGEWNATTNDYNWDVPMQHQIFLILPASLKENAVYTLEIDSKTETDRTTANVTFDIFNSRSEAIHVNLVGYSPSTVVRSADVYIWMGDGKGRDYASFEGNKVFLYNINTKAKSEVGKLEFWKENQWEVQHNFTQSDVWIADFNSNVTPGNYRIAIEGIGCSADFEIKKDVYKTPFDVSVKGYYYMRIGEDCMECVPVPRRPLYIPNVDPPNTKVYITTMHPYHPEWRTFARGDVWDAPNSWKPYMKEGAPTNPKAIGGHSDAYDWDRHLGHVSNIYDMLLPFVITNGALTDDDCGIRESGNGLPDILDEARNEVDFWLNLRDGEGYSHGLTNPNSDNELYQAGNTTIAAWANAVNSAMLGYCFQLIDKKDLQKQYLDSAVVAFNYAMRQPDQMLDRKQDMGHVTLKGKTLKMTAAVYLYNLTGDRKYEDIFYENCEIRSDNAVVADSAKFQIWAVAGYLFTKQPVNYPDMYKNIAHSVIAEAHRNEASYINIRPSRRGTDNDVIWFNDVTLYHTSHTMHRTMIAHAITKNQKEKDFFYKAMIMEADWGLGRNPLNMIQMTTATTPLENKRSVVNMFTVGRNDGTPGMHPGHTPYLNAYDWGSNSRAPAAPSWMVRKSYPEETNFRRLQVWPMGEIYFDTRYVYAHSEFTPQQTMRGKMALYGYLHAIEKNEGVISSLKEVGFYTDWHLAGIPGGIPNGTVTHATLNAGATAEQINNAIQAAGDAVRSSGGASPANLRIVQLGEGIFEVGNTDILLNRSGVILRGMGSSTIIRGTNGGDGVFVIGNQRPTWQNAVDVTQSAFIGDSIITVADVSGFDAGQILKIDRFADDASAENGGSEWLDGHNQFQRGRNNEFGPTGGSARPISQFIEITSIQGNTLHLSNRININFPVTGASGKALSPQVFNTMAHENQYIGLENIKLEATGTTVGGNQWHVPAVQICLASSYCWVKNIESDGTKFKGENGFMGRHIELNGFRNHVTGNYVHHSSQVSPGGQGYGIRWHGTDCIIDNNISDMLNKPLLGQTSNGGNVIAYNYVPNAIITIRNDGAYVSAATPGNPQTIDGWNETAIDPSHGGYSHSDLFEGNYTANLHTDGTSNNGFFVLFRNHSFGKNAHSLTTGGSWNAVCIDGPQNEHASIGNVYLNPTNAVGARVWNSPANSEGRGMPVYNLTARTGNNTMGSYLSDGGRQWAYDRFYWAHDYNYVNNNIEPSRQSGWTVPDELPNSLYLTAAPDYFTGYTWPPVNPYGKTDSERIGVLPARARHDAIISDAK